MNHQDYLPNDSPVEKEASPPSSYSSLSLSDSAASLLSIESILKALIENSFDLAGLLDENFNYLYVSESVDQIFDNKAGALFGYTGNQLLGQNCFELVHPDDRTRVTEQVGSLLTGEKKVQLSPYRIRDKEEKWHWLEAIVTNQLNNPAVQAIVVSAREVTQQVETERKLKELQVTEALMEGEEKERIRIARDLHDEISGMIAAAKMLFGTLREKTPQVQTVPEYEQGMALLENAALQVRRISHNLMPEILLNNGLDNALSRYCQSISNDHCRLSYFSLSVIGRFSFQFELSLYRIAQELINNIIRHSGASGALIQLSRKENHLSLTIEDNGTGFSKEQEEAGTGLSSIKRRVEAMNGHLELQSESGKGTSIYIEFEL